MSKKFGFGGVPRLVDIISAIPDEYKKALLPKLRARPIRTASGVRLFPRRPPVCAFLMLYCLDCGGCGHVQAASVSTHRHDREYLCVSAFGSEATHDLMSDIDIAQGDLIRTSITARRATLATSPRVCVPSEPVMTHTNKRVDALSN